MSQNNAKEIIEEFSEPSYDKLLDHEYDGIREYDNPLPGWWKNIFYVSIVFSVGYWFYYHAGGPGMTLQQLHAIEVAEAKADMEKRRGKDFEKKLATEFKTLIGKKEAIAKGKAAYTKNACFACHRADGGGLIGPDLTDDYWVFGPDPLRIYKTISNGGRAGKGMEAWGKKIPPNDIKNIVAFIISLRGTNPKNPKPHGSDETKFPN
ncbi:MAG: c-type cytochrome [Myxococcales bacterium]|nr:c-type cytochrome [Myxococcales bacterium]